MSGAFRRGRLMIYPLYQGHADLTSLPRDIARFTAGLAAQIDFGAFTPRPMRHAAAALGIFADAALTHRRPSFRIDTTRIGEQDVTVREEIATGTPFGDLLHFRKDIDYPQPRVLIVAPMSGHFATLLRGTVVVMLPDHDVYITDWKNARDIPKDVGCFGFDEYVDHIISFLEAMGPGGHVVAVCQPAVATLAAVAVMAEAGNPAQPRSMTLMAGPIDTRVNPTKVNELATSRPIEWFAKNLIDKVPWRFQGAGRRVYPGFLQLMAFMSMNLDRHIAAHTAQYRAVLNGDLAGAQAHRMFYEEYGAVMDLPAEFYLETVQRVFQDHDLPLGKLTWHGQKIRPGAIRHTALLTVEGERDDICAIGQTMAAQELCSSISVARKQHHLQTGVGHYGVFSGKRWAREIYPRLREMIEMTTDIAETTGGR
jgi:poly(3-hydroxybutyrate) depolymerase